MGKNLTDLPSHYTEPTHSVTGTLDGSSITVGIVVAEFNRHITASLLMGAIQGLHDHDVSDNNIHTYWVPGAFEVPVVTDAVLSSVDVVIAIACIIKGDTPHFDYICSSVTNSIMYISVINKKPIGFGILTCLNKKQALLRSDPHKKNKGKEAALAIFSVHNSK